MFASCYHKTRWRPHPPPSGDGPDVSGILFGIESGILPPDSSDFFARSVRPIPFIEEMGFLMYGTAKIKSLVQEKIVDPQKNTAALAAVALSIAVIALIIAVRKGK